MSQDQTSRTWWSDLRWRVALKIVGRAMWIAPPGTARDRWGDYQRAWTAEIREATNSVQS